MRSDGIEIQRCYLDYLEALVSHYKAARSSRNPTGGYEGIRRFEDYHGDGNMDGSLAAKEKGRRQAYSSQKDASSDSLGSKPPDEGRLKDFARSSRNPTGGYEGIRRFEDYHGDGNMDGSLAAKEKGRVEHFGITLKEEEEGKHKLMHTSYCQ
ncbi:hypothetical protein Tco_1538367 [Tanacetum coccineum]